MLDLFRVIKSTSAIFPAGMSYALNVLIASSVVIEDYTSYISLISWATYLGTISAFSFVDLSISNKFRTTNNEDNLLLSLMVSLVAIFSCFIFFNFFSVLPEYVAENSLLLAVLALALCWTRCLHLFCANTKKINTLIISRCSRALVLFVLGFIYILFNINDYVSAMYFQLAALVVGLIVGYRVLVKLKLKTISNLSFPMVKLSFLRTFSLGISMIHLPILFFILNQTVESALNYDESKVFLLGLGIPFISVLTQIINEYARGRIDNFIKFFQDKNSIINFFIPVLSLLIFVFFIQNYHSENFLYLMFVFFAFGKLSSAFVGLFIFRLGFEKYDLLINTFTTIILLAVIWMELFEASLLVNISLGILTGKYLMSISLVARSMKRIILVN